jgi:hypothetical protein
MTLTESRNGTWTSEPNEDIYPRRGPFVGSVREESFDRELPAEARSMIDAEIANILQGSNQYKVDLTNERSTPVSQAEAAKQLTRHLRRLQERRTARTCTLTTLTVRS